MVVDVLVLIIDRLDLNASAGIRQRTEQRCKVNGHFNELVLSLTSLSRTRSTRHYHPIYEISRYKSGSVRNACSNINIMPGTLLGYLPAIAKL